VSVEVTASSSQITATASGSTVAAAVGSTTVSASSSGGIGPQGPAGPQGEQGEPGEGGGGDFLPLAGGTMTGNIVFDATGGQFIGKGLVDTERGGSYGISLVCSIGYQFNWQAGWILATEQNGSTPRPLYLDSVAGTTLRVWDAEEDEGVEIAHDGITFADNTTQTTAATAYTLPIATGATLGGILVGTGLVSFGSGRVDVSYGTASGTACQGNDSRLSNARTPTSHSHGNITNAGAIGSTSGQIVVTTTSGVLTTAASISLSQLSQSSATSGQVVAWNGTAWAPAAASGYTLPNATTSTLGGVIVGTGLGVTSGTISVSYGSSSSTACAGDDSRLSDARTPTAHNQAWSTITSTPTSLSGYGITDAVGSSDARLTDSRTPTSHTHGLGDLTQGGATNGQVIAWSGSAWAPATVSGGGGSTSASDLTSGTLADARLSTNARQAVEQFVHPFLLMGG
jgi:hypothetical protein